MVEPLYLNFRVCTVKLFGVGKFRNFTVLLLQLSQCNDPKFSDGYPRVNISEQRSDSIEGRSDQGLYCFQFILYFIHVMKHFSVVKFLCLNFRVITTNLYGV